MSASSASAIPYIGSKISLVTNSELRYEGTLININTVNSTVTLRDVRMSGTEGRKAPGGYVMPSPEVYDFIIFNGKDIKDLTVSEPAFSVKEDPAVVAVNVAPLPPQQTMGYGDSHHMQGGYDNMMGGYHRPDGGYNTHPQAHPNSHPGPHVPHHPRGFSPMGRGGMYGGRGRDYYSYGGPGGGRGYGRIGGGRGGMNNSNASKNIVGELTAQPNNSLKTQVAQAFDFEEANQKFEKEKVAVEGAAEGSGVATAAKGAYDKNTSFFDNISCETLNRQHGRDSKIDREKQRELDTETFGPAAALSRGPRYYRRGYRRPGTMRGGRGGDGYNPGAGYNPNGRLAFGYRNGPIMPHSYVRAQ
eukprot:Blabericola_migrator_1__7298@NODE_3710_length_1562_cov_792_458863_g676_i1_p1_GENE_NODE_3710_length_1562_cov_792_458863_g676_i1NODE_3710_length_1562_cov_792_458863_g676_i1_p1_ORF_typecomplete_len406_score41_67LSM14/PF12701_7/1_4e27FDF/PF09532_10/4_5e12Mfp3/PF04202_13/0_021Mfp3/PF04202_13/1_8e04Mfp3/PF04202_13/3_2e03Mfp3/PF04202_13/1_8e04SMATX/PF14438_6/0_069_NODE_3710_length_1562_cov_792_458863_g676_i11421218